MNRHVVQAKQKTGGAYGAIGLLITCCCIKTYNPGRRVRGDGNVPSGIVGMLLGAPITAGMPGFNVIIAAGGTARQWE